MINEKMTELLALVFLIERMDTKKINILTGTITENGKQYDFNKMVQRCGDLVEEFMQPYAIDSTSKED